MSEQSTLIGQDPSGYCALISFQKLKAPKAPYQGIYRLLPCFNGIGVASMHGKNLLQALLSHLYQIFSVLPTYHSLYVNLRPLQCPTLPGVDIRFSSLSLWSQFVLSAGLSYSFQQQPHICSRFRFNLLYRDIN